MRVWALMDGDDPLAVELYLTRAAAERELADAIGDVPEWEELLWVERVDLDDAATSPN